MPEFVGLRRGAFRISLTDNDEGGCLYILDEVNRRTFLVNGGIVVNRCAEERDHPLAYQVLTVVALPVRNAGAGDSSVETIGLRDSPHCHVTTVAPTSHSEMSRVDWIFLCRSVDSGKDVAKIAVSEILYIRAGKFLALSVTTARVRHQHVVTT